MAGYRRFIAYVYEYRKGKKENNCGFIKVEVRDEACTMEVHLHVEGLAENEECKVYCFLRKEGLMNGILLGTCETENERIECFIETDALNVGNSGLPLGKMGGMILTTKSGGVFGTEWDDQAIRPENFKEAGSFAEENGGREAEEAETERKNAEKGNENQKTKTRNVEEPKENREIVPEKQIRDAVDNPADKSEEKTKTDMEEKAEEGTEKDKKIRDVSEKMAEPGEENAPEPDTKLAAEAILEPGSETSEEKPERPETEVSEEIKRGSSTEIAAETLARSEAAEEISQEPGPGSELPRNFGSELDLAMPEETTPESIQESTQEPNEDLTAAPSAPPGEPASMSEALHMQSSHAERVRLPFGQEFCPFEDSDVRQCWKIHPQDLVHFPRRQCALRNNRFLQYGYYNFGHLLLCRRQNGRYIIGVPGCYDQQEQFMAGMFGFSCFKPSKQIKVPKGKGGYWYRAIDPPGCC